MNPRTRLLMALALGLSMLAAALLWWQTGRTQAVLREQLLVEAEQRSQNLADAMAGQVEGLVGVLDVGLLSVRRDWLRRGGEDFTPVAQAALQALPRDLELRLCLLDRQGRPVFRSDGPVPPPSPHAAALPAFLALRDGIDRLYIGSPQRRALDGEWVVPVARPVLRGGRFDGVVILELASDVLARRLSALVLAPGDGVALTDREGGFIARSQDNAGAMGQRLALEPRFASTPAAVGGSFRGAEAADGTVQVVGWRRIQPLGLVVTVGLAEATVLAPLAPAIEQARELPLFFSALLVLGGAWLALMLRQVALGDARVRSALALRNRLFDSSRVLMGVIDPADGRLLECNAAALRAYGRGDREQTLGCGLSEVSAPEQADGRASSVVAAEQIARALAQGLAVFEWWHQRPDGQRWDAEMHLMRFEAGGRALLQFTAIDITARREAEQRLRTSESRLREAQRIAAIGHWELDLRTRRAQWSDEVNRILELEPGAQPVSFELFMSRVHPDDHELLRSTYVDLARARELRDLVHRLRMPDGRIKHVRHSGYTEYEDGRPVRSVGTVQDISSVREAEEALRGLNEELEQRVAARARELSQLNRELESFAYSVSHDLRTPLRGIHGFAELLAEEEGERLGTEGQAYLSRIRQGAEGMRRLIDALLSLSRVSRVELHPDWVDISALSRQLAAELRGGEPQRRVHWWIEDGLWAWGDPTLLTPVLQNLLGNAWKYSRHRSPAEIRVTRAPAAEGETAFMVGDNGAGFDMQHAGQLFEPFRRLHSQREFEGTGIGLATVQRIVERHGGWIRGEGEPGRGARFSVGLPWPGKAPDDPGRPPVADGAARGP